jgi:hypothetical protein
MGKFQPKKDDVSVSFHRLRRFIDSDGGKIPSPIGISEFKALLTPLNKLKGLNLDDEETSLKVRSRLIAKIDDLEDFDDRYIAGIFKGAYWGHSFDNTHLGKVPADSINFRPFFFLLYLSEKGELHLATQYLGTFGGYTAIRNSITDCFPEHASITATSFNYGGYSLKNFAPKEVQINYSRKSSSITAGNSFGQSGAITFKKRGKDDGFEGDVNQRILSHASKAPKEIRKALADLLSDNKVVELKDEDIEDCKVIALVNGKRKTIHMINENGFATRFPVDVPLDGDGHPVYAPLKEKVLALLRNQIIATTEDV